MAHFVKNCKVRTYKTHSYIAGLGCNLIMEYPDVFSSTLGLSPPWQITDVSFALQGKRMDITISFSALDAIQCPLCGAIRQMAHAVNEVWFHGDFFSHTTYLHTQVPYIQCCELIAVERPWSRGGSKFSLMSS